MLSSCKTVSRFICIFFFVLFFRVAPISVALDRNGNACVLLRGSFKKICMPKMDRAGFALLMILTVVLVRVGDGQRDAAGGRKEGAGAGRAVWDQLQSRGISRGHSPRGPRDGSSSRTSSDSSPGTSQSRTLVRLPRGTSSQENRKHISKERPVHAAATSGEDLVSAPRDGARRTARHPTSQQQRNRVNRRQSSRHSSASTKRLIG